MKYKLNKKLGQHFLFDDKILNKIAESTDLNKLDKVVEIGPGSGSLTQKLLMKDIELISVELDKKWADEVRSKFNSYKNFKVINGDALKIDWEKIGDGKEFTVVGNIPYQITSPLHFSIIENRNYINKCVFLMQKEVAERIAAKSGSKKFGIISIAVQYYFDAEILFEVPPQAFTPPPKVNSTVLRLIKKVPEQNLVKNWKHFMVFIHELFNQRRKMIRNSLKKRLEQCNLDGELDEYLTKRPEQLSIEQLINLYNILIQKGVNYG